MDKRRSRAPSYLPSAAAAMGRASPCAESCSKRPRSAKIIMMITIIMITIEMIMICYTDGKIVVAILIVQRGHTLQQEHSQENSNPANC